MKRDARGKRTSLTNVVSRPCQSVTVVLCRADIENRLCLMYVRGAENRTKTTMDSSLSSNPEPKHEQPLPLSLQWFRRNHTHTRRPATCLPLLLHFPRRYVFWCLGPLSLHLVRRGQEECDRRSVGAVERVACVYLASSGTYELGKRHGQRRAAVSAPPSSLSHNGMNGVRWQVRGVCMERVSLHVRVLQPKHLCMGLV